MILKVGDKIKIISKEITGLTEGSTHTIVRHMFKESWWMENDYSISETWYGTGWVFDDSQNSAVSEEKIMRTLYEHSITSTPGIDGICSYCTVNNYPPDYHGKRIMNTPEKIITNEQGGMQSDIGAAYHLIPAKALEVVAKVFAEGAKKYTINNWKLIPTDEHINHAVNHMYKHLANDPTEEHLAHAACRALMALSQYLEEKQA